MFVASLHLRERPVGVIGQSLLQIERGPQRSLATTLLGETMMKLVCLVAISRSYLCTVAVVFVNRLIVRPQVA